MALAIWDITTITTGTTLFGTTGRWATFPDAFPPIGYMMTTTPTKATSAYGLYAEYIASTSPVSSPATLATQGGIIQAVVPWKVRSYQKGTRSFLIAETWATITTTAKLPEATTPSTTVGSTPVKRLILYYRSLSEYGDTPS